MPHSRQEAGTAEGDVRAVVRALSILDAFSTQHSSLTLQEISDRLSMAKATTFRLVNTVCRAGYLVRLSDQSYCLSLKLAKLGSMVRSTLSIRDMALPIMKEANRASAESIGLNVANEGERVCLEVVDTPSLLMTIVRVAEHVPLLFGATGRILLSQMDAPMIEQILRTSPGGANVDRVLLERELNRFRVQGYALTRGQRVPGVTAIAVPIRSPQSHDRYCLALTGPSVRVDARELEFVELMLDAGKQISNLLGASQLTSASADTTDGDSRDAHKEPHRATKRRPMHGQTTRVERLI